MHELATVSIDQLNHVTGGVIINTRGKQGRIKLNAHGSVDEPLAHPNGQPLKLNAHGSVDEPLAFPNRFNTQGSVNWVVIPNWRYL